MELRFSEQTKAGTLAWRIGVSQDSSSAIADKRDRHQCRRSAMQELCEDARDAQEHRASISFEKCLEIILAGGIEDALLFRQRSERARRLRVV